MSDFLSGRSIAEAREWIERFIRIMEGRENPDGLDAAGDLAALKEVILYPVRAKCATLPWHALRKLIWRNK